MNRPSNGAGQAVPRVAAGPGTAGEPLLAVSGLTIRFGGIVALSGISFSVEPGTICGIIGPNGSGKTTLFNCLSGIYRPNAGRIVFAGRDLGEVPRHRLAGLGLGRTFQNVALFDSMTVRENLLAGAHHFGRSGFVANAIGTPAARRVRQDGEARLAATLDLIGLASAQHEPVAGLPFPTRKRVELARALITSPRLLLLDEPAGGLNHEEVDDLAATILRLKAELGLTTLLIEHHMNLVMRVSDKVVAFDGGQKIADGPPDEVRQVPAVITAYLGAEVS